MSFPVRLLTGWADDTDLRTISYRNRIGWNRIELRDEGRVRNGDQEGGVR